MEMDYSMEIPALNLLYLSLPRYPPFFIWRFYVPLFSFPSLFTFITTQLNSLIRPSNKEFIFPLYLIPPIFHSPPIHYLCQVVKKERWNESSPCGVEKSLLTNFQLNIHSEFAEKKKFISLLPAHINSRFFHSNNNNNKQIEENFSWNWNRI